MSSKLESLTQEEIKQRELAPGDLWIIKMGEEIKGPFEYENLKIYTQENESLFEQALASRLEPQDWKPLFSYPQFQRRSPQLVTSSQASDGPFWLHENGLKTGPFEKFHILKRLEMNSLIVTDKISLDDGKSWINIYEVPEFDRRDLINLSLPVAPAEQTLAQLYGKSEQEDHIEEESRTKDMTSELLAQSAHRGLYKSKVLTFNPSGYSLPKKEEGFFSRFTLPEWFLPSSVALGLMMVGGVLFTLVSGPAEEPLTVADITRQSKPLGEKRTVNPSAQLAQKNRAPASVHRTTPKTQLRPAIKNIQANDNIPTTIHTHHVDRYPSNDHADPEYGHYEEPYTDPYDNPFDDGEMIVHEAPPAASLVPREKRTLQRLPSSSTIGDVMGYEENVIDEASDF